jgi:hypothetical protein
MRRTLALCAAAVALRAAPAAAQPMELELARLGAPSDSVWNAIFAQCSAAGSCPGVASVNGGQLAFESQQRYRQTVVQLGLGLTSFVLEDATTGGMDGWEIGLEGASSPIRHSNKGATAAPFGPAPTIWPVRGDDPTSMRTWALHVQKPLPWSLVLGGRLLNVDQSQMFAVQGEARWALNENYFVHYVPDVAARVAYTRLFGARALDLSVIDLDLIVSKRFGLAGAVRLTPYGVVRYSSVSAHTSAIDFGPTSGACATSTCYPDTRTPAEVAATSTPFPDARYSDNAVVRYALGTKLNAGSLALALELTYYPGKLLKQTSTLYSVMLPDSMGGALRFGGDF